MSFSLILNEFSRNLPVAHWTFHCAVKFPTIAQFFPTHSLTSIGPAFVFLIIKIMAIFNVQLQSQTEHFKPLIRTKCSPHILFFVCSTFAPMCPEQMPQAVTSCRSVRKFHLGFKFLSKIPILLIQFKFKFPHFPIKMDHSMLRSAKRCNEIASKFSKNSTSLGPLSSIVPVSHQHQPFACNPSQFETMEMMT